MKAALIERTFFFMCNIGRFDFLLRIDTQIIFFITQNYFNEGFLCWNMRNFIFKIFLISYFILNVVLAITVSVSKPKRWLVTCFWMFVQKSLCFQDFSTIFASKCFVRSFSLNHTWSDVLTVPTLFQTISYNIYMKFLMHPFTIQKNLNLSEIFIWDSLRCLIRSYFVWNIFLQPGFSFN